MSRARLLILLSVLIAMTLVAVPSAVRTAAAETDNIKVVTDANPDYSDIGSMIYSTLPSGRPPRRSAGRCFAGTTSPAARLSR